MLSKFTHGDCFRTDDFRGALYSFPLLVLFLHFLFFFFLDILFTVHFLLDLLFSARHGPQVSGWGYRRGCKFVLLR
jgi:hypothetical protein